MTRDRRIAIARHRRRRYLGCVRITITRAALEACTPAPFSGLAQLLLERQAELVPIGEEALARMAVGMKWFGDGPAFGRA